MRHLRNVESDDVSEVKHRHVNPVASLEGAPGNKLITEQST